MAQVERVQRTSERPRSRLSSFYAKLCRQEPDLKIANWQFSGLGRPDVLESSILADALCLTTCRPAAGRRPAQHKTDERSSGKNNRKHWRRCGVLVSTNPATCKVPAISKVRNLGLTILKMPAAKGWKFGCLPEVSPGPEGQCVHSGLDHPRLIEVLTNGDMLVAEIKKQARPPKGPFRAHRA